VNRNVVWIISAAVVSVALLVGIPVGRSISRSHQPPPTTFSPVQAEDHRACSAFLDAGYKHEADALRAEMNEVQDNAALHYSQELVALVARVQRGINLHDQEAIGSALIDLQTYCNRT
jgi:hypothetical protein